MEIAPNPPHSPELAPCDFALFPKMKFKLKGRRFDTVDIIQQEAQKVLDNFTENDFMKLFQDWQTHWDRCIQSHGDYFEGH